MNTRLFMASQAGILGSTGILLLFVPEWIAGGLEGGTVPAYFWTQVAAAGTLAFAAQNWFGRSAIYGGIYGKPIVFGNLVFGIVTSMALLKMILGDGGSAQMMVLLLIYGQFAAGYALLLFRGPRPPAGGSA